MRIPAEEYLELVRNAPIVSIDLIVRNTRGEVLLGWRNNRPAASCWFVPGGRVLKGERLAEAVIRVARDELGLELAPGDAEFVGPYEHFYEDNFADAPDVPTHFVVLAHRIETCEELAAPADEQHRALRWWSTQELLEADDVHPNTKAYFQFPRIPIEPPN
jgi:colanic acid biosynthesis protein WcaH